VQAYATAERLPRLYRVRAEEIEDASTGALSNMRSVGDLGAEKDDMTEHSSSQRGAAVFAVEWGNGFPAEIDSLWTTEEEAQKRAEEMSESWRVTRWTLREHWEPEE